MLDFVLDEKTGYLQPTGHYSRCKAREASREEALLYRRLWELEALFEKRRPPEVRALLDRIPTDANRVRINPFDHAQLVEYASDRVQPAALPATSRDGIVSMMPTMNDGSPSLVWIIVDPAVPSSEVRVEP